MGTERKGFEEKNLSCDRSRLCYEYRMKFLQLQWVRPSDDSPAHELRANQRQSAQADWNDGLVLKGLQFDSPQFMRGRMQTQRVNSKFCPGSSHE
jgi:hypothetical protein